GAEEARHRPAAAEPARSRDRTGAGRGDAGCARPRTRRRVHRAQEDGMDRVRAPCLGLGNRTLRGVLLMCGIVGLLLKKPAWDARLGELLVPMLVGMTERGPDSAGLAVYSSAPSVPLKLSLFHLHGEPDWGAFLRNFNAAFPGEHSLHDSGRHAVLGTRAQIE